MSAKLTWLATWSLLAILSLSALLLQFHLAVNLDFDGELLSTDAESLYGLRCARDGESPYHDFSRPPHVVTLYGPLFYMAPGTAARLLNTSWIGTIICGRLYTYIAWFGVAVMLYALTRQIGCEERLAVMAGLLWLAGSVAWQWAVAYRPDAPALLLSLAAMWVYQRRTSRLALVMTLVLLAAAFLHKQTSVAVWLALVATEAAQRRWRRAVVVFGGWLIAIAAAFMITQLFSQGAYAKNAFGAVMLWVSPDQVVELLRRALIGGIATFAGGWLAIIITHNDQRLRLVRMSYVISFAIALATSMKAGANLNYYLEPFAMGCVLSAGLIQYGTDAAARKPVSRVAMGWLMVAIVASTVMLCSRIEQAPDWWRAIVDHSAVRAQEAQEWNQIGSCLGEWKGAVLVEDSYLAMHQSKDCFLLHPRQFAALHEAGMFDDSQLCRRLATGGFEAIIANSPLEEQTSTRQFPARWLEAAVGHYVMEKRCDRDMHGDAFYIYRPVPQADEVPGRKQKP